MKKYFKFFIASLLVCLFTFTLSPILSANEPEGVKVGPGYYELNDKIEENQLEASVQHAKYTAYASSDLTGFRSAGSDQTSEDNVSGKLYPQSVNVLSIPTGSIARIVNWTNVSRFTWAVGTVKEIAASFEYHNPGWTVIAAVNGDFFDINSKNAFALRTTGLSVSNGEVTIGEANFPAVGFTNDGSTNTLIGYEEQKMSEYHTLTLYNQNEEVIKVYDIKSLNETPASGEIAIFYPYQYFNASEVRTWTAPTAPANSQFCALADRCLGVSGTNVYAKGTTELSTEAKNLTPGQFAIYTDSTEINSEISAAAKVRVQKEVEGVYANCENITGVNVELVRNGLGLVSNDKNRHPRTVVGMKEDGTVMFFTVDGRQSAKDMYGMTNDEMAAMLLYHGCVKGYNLDGGGSTTMIIREGNSFRVLNSPSDGNERRDGNALLIVIPKISISLGKVTDTTATFTVPNPSKGITIENIKVKVDGNEKEVKIGENELTGLTPHKSYDLSCTYDITYNNLTSNVSSPISSFVTGYAAPVVNKFEVVQKDGYYEVEYDINDENSVIELAGVQYGTQNKWIQNIQENGKGTLRIDATDISSFTLRLQCNLDAFPNYQYIVEKTATPSKASTGGGFNCNKAGIAYIFNMIAVAGIILILKKKK